MENKEGLVISHSIALNNIQREKLFNTNEEIEVIGVSVPVWIESGMNVEPNKELFVKYKISTSTGQSIAEDVEGYKIKIKVGEIKDLLDVRKGGVGALWINEISATNDGGNNYPTIHQIHIFSENSLKESLAFVHLD